MTSYETYQVAYFNQLEKTKAKDIFLVIENILGYSKDFINIVDNKADNIEFITNNIISFIKEYTDIDLEDIDSFQNEFFSKSKQTITLAQVGVDNLEQIVSLLKDQNYSQFWEEYKGEALDLYNGIRKKVNEVVEGRAIDIKIVEEIEKVVFSIINGHKDIEYKNFRLSNEQIDQIQNVIKNIKNPKQIFNTLRFPEENLQNHDLINIKGELSLSNLVALMGAGKQTIVDLGDMILENLDLNKIVENNRYFNDKILQSPYFKDFNAPAAAAFVSGVYGLIDAVNLFRSSQINEDEFLNLITINGVDTAGMIVGSIIGQTLIPIPVVGATLGTLVAKGALEIGNFILNEKEKQLINDYNNYIEEFVRKLDDEYQVVFNMIQAKYNEISNIQNFVFDVNYNIELKFSYSIELADLVGVDPSKVLRNIEDIDDFFLN